MPNLNEAYINAFSVALGEQTLTVEESFEKGLLVTQASHFRDAGFGTHRICLPETNAYDLARRATKEIEPLLKNVGAIVYTTCLPLNGNIGDVEKLKSTGDVKHVMDFPGSHLQADFGLETASVIGLNQQACTSLLGSLRLAKSLLSSESDLEQILCVTADRFPHGASYEQAYNVISDGASTFLVSRKPEGYRIISSHAITNGALAQASDDETVGSYFSYTHRLIQEILAKSKMKIEDIHWIVPQNTNVNAWTILARVIGIDIDRVFFGTIRDIGHLISSDNVVNLQQLEKMGSVKSGQKLLLFMAGFGLNWQAVILEKV